MRRPTTETLRLLRQLRHLNGGSSMARVRCKRRARADPGRADNGVGHRGRSLRSSTTRLPCLGSGQYLFTDAGSARARPTSVSARSNRVVKQQSDQVATYT